MSSEPRRFLEAVLAGKPEQQHVLIWTLPDKRSHWFDVAEEAIDFVEENSARSLYIGVGFSPADHGPANRCKADEISGIVCLWMDIDLQSDAHPGKPLPKTIDDALSVLPPDLPPTIVVLTGNGIHVWWLFRKPWIFESPEERAEAAALVLRFTTLIRDTAALRGWSIDRLADLSRVLRVPGTMNLKVPAKPKPVSMQSIGEARYDPADIADYLDSLGVPDEDQEIHSSQELADRFNNIELAVNLGARVPEERIHQWCSSDLRFRNTWFRQRHDLKDQSQSGYDLALACFGIQAGLDPQQLVDLMVHHRAMHKTKHRSRADYFKRTIAKAQNGVESKNFNAPTRNGSPEGIAEPPSNGSTREITDMQKIQSCRTLSRLLGIEILRIKRIVGKSPVYRMELDCGAIVFSSISKFISQKAVRHEIAALAGRMLRPFKAPDWSKIAQLLLDACIDEDGGPELTEDGLARIYIHAYLSESTYIDTLEGQPLQTVRLPLLRADYILIQSMELQSYANKAFGQNLTLAEICSMLSAIGAQAVRVRIGRSREQSRWQLPREQFAPEECLNQAGEQE